MKHEETYEDDWKKEAPFLASLESKPADEVPEGYFEGLPDRVMAAIREESAPTGGQVPQAPGGSFSRWSNWTTWAAAASVALLVSAGVYLLRQEPAASGQLDQLTAEARTEEALEALSTEELVAYIDPADYTEAELLALADPNDIQGLQSMPAHVDLIDYLEDTDLEGLDLSGLELDASHLF